MAVEGTVSLNNKHEIQKSSELAPLLLQVQTEVLGNKNSTSSTTKKLTDAAPALSSLGGGSVLLFLSNILIQLLHLS